MFGFAERLWQAIGIAEYVDIIVAHLLPFTVKLLY